MSERKRTTRLERAELAREIDARTAQVHARIDSLAETEHYSRIDVLDAIRADLEQLDEDISYLQKVTREDRSWG